VSLAIQTEDVAELPRPVLEHGYFPRGPAGGDPGRRHDLGIPAQRLQVLEGHDRLRAVEGADRAFFVAVKLRTRRLQPIVDAVRAHSLVEAPYVGNPVSV